MPKPSFTNKILNRLDRIDRKSMEALLLELAQSNSLQEKVIHSLEDGLLLTDAQGNITFVNQPFLSLFQAAEEKWLGHALSSFLNAANIPQEDFLQNLFRDYQVYSNDLLLESPSPHWIRLHASPLLDAEKKFIGACVTFKDITTLKQHEEQRLHVERLGTLIPLAAGLAHEIGNPLNTLAIHIQLAQREIKNLPTNKQKKMTHNLRVAKEEIQRLDRIVTQFLSTVRPFKSHLRLKNINDLLNATLDLMAPEISLANISVERRFQTQLPSALVDEDQLKQAFLNLIKNALQAMPKGGQLLVQTELKNQQLQIVFADTGVGIPADQLNKIFEPYYSTKAKGTGLGLVTVSRVVSDHGGKIQVKSTPGKGSRFVILLPRSGGEKPLLPRSGVQPQNRKKIRV